MIRKKAIKRVIWKMLLFTIGTIIFGTPFVPVLIMYALKAIGFRGRNFDPEADAKLKASMFPEDVASYENTDIFVTLALPLLPYLIFTLIFPQYQEIANVIALLTVYFLFFKPLVVDIIRIITNSEESTAKVKKIGNIGMIVLIVGCILYMIFFPVFVKANLDHIGLWKDYVKETKLDAQLASCLDDVELEFNSKNTNAKAIKEMEPIKENGFIYENKLYVYYAYNAETKEWFCEHDFIKTNTKEIYETTSWSGTGNDMFHTVLFSDDKTYTLTLDVGKLSEVTVTFAISDTNGTLMEEYNVTCVESKEDRYRLSADRTIGNYIDSFIVVYDEKQNTFVFDDYNIKGTLTKK
ncbi:MAG: hypothetical protein IKK65_00350 [Clostridia bacterium]|nr:hypothetical protein [Clostridia bacterium]